MVQDKEIKKAYARGYHKGCKINAAGTALKQLINKHDRIRREFNKEVKLAVDKAIKENDRSWRETLDILNDDRTMEGIKKSLQQIKEGRTIPLSELDVNVGVSEQ